MQCQKPDCSAHAMRGHRFCVFHSERPEVIKLRQEARSRGGKSRRPQMNDKVESIEDVKLILVEALNELRSSATNNTVTKSRAIGYLCGILLQAVEKADLEKRVEELESKFLTT